MQKIKKVLKTNERRRDSIEELAELPHQPSLKALFPSARPCSLGRFLPPKRLEVFAYLPKVFAAQAGLRRVVWANVEANHVAPKHLSGTPLLHALAVASGHL